MLFCLDLNIRSIFCNMYWTLLRVWSLLFTTPIMKLNWLPVSQRITFKICLLIYKALKGLAPIYLSDLLAPRCYKHSLKSCAQELNTRASQCTLSEAVSELVKETLLSETCKIISKLVICARFLPAATRCDHVFPCISFGRLLEQL